jgi:hypothetical protein
LKNNFLLNGGKQKLLNFLVRLVFILQAEPVDKRPPQILKAAFSKYGCFLNSGVSTNGNRSGKTF